MWRLICSMSAVKTPDSGLTVFTSCVMNSRCKGTKLGKIETNKTPPPPLLETENVLLPCCSCNQHTHHTIAAVF